MKLNNNQFITLDCYLYDNAGNEFGKKAYRAWVTYRTSGNIDEYIVISVEGYSAITKMFNENEYDNLVQPFDSERVYPLQKVKQSFEFVCGDDDNENL